MKYYQFPEELSDIRNILQELIPVLENGDERLYGFSYLENSEKMSINISNTEITNKEYDRGIVLRILAGNKNFEYATNKIDKKELMENAKELNKKALEYLKKNNIKETYTPEKIDVTYLKDYHPLIQEQYKNNPNKIHFGTPFDEKYPLNFNMSESTEYAKVFYEKINQKSQGITAKNGVALNQSIITKIFIDRYKNMSQSLLISTINIYCFTKNGVMPKIYIGGLSGFEIGKDISDNDIDELIKEAEKFNNAKKIKPGRYKIITGPDVTGVIAHEAFGHTQEGDTCRLGRSCAPLIRKEKRKIGNDMATIINNAAVFSMGNKNYGQNGSHFFDDEGQLAKEHIILDKGYLGTPMNDLLSSVVGDINGKAPRQSNGKRESWRRPLMARQTNTYFSTGDKTLDEMIKKVDYGFLAEVAYGGMEDPKGMGLTAGTMYFEEIKDGKLTGEYYLGPHGGHIELSDPVPDLLSKIVAKSKVYDDYKGDLDKQPIPFNKTGGCGKYHKEFVLAGSGGPYILWENINCG